MRVLILPSWYPTPEDPVRGSFFAEQAEALAAHGHTVSVFPVYGGAGEPCRVEERRRSSLTEYAIHVRPIPFHLTYFRVLNAMARLLCAMPREERPEIVHVHSFAAAKYARALKALFGIPYVITEHVSWFARDILSARELRMAARAFGGAAAVLAVSPGLAERIRPYCGGREPRVVTNLVDRRFFETPPAPRDGKDFAFLSVGHLERVKGHDVLLRAFAALLKSGREASLTLCGSGGEEAALRALAAELGLGEQLRLTGAVPHGEVAERMDECDCFVLASRTETFGLVYAEAMARGRPIIMTKTDAWELLAAPETGLAVETDDADALAEAMGRMMDEYRRYEPAAIAAYCRERFSPEAVCARLTEIYEEVLGA